MPPRSTRRPKLDPKVPPFVPRSSGPVAGPGSSGKRGQAAGPEGDDTSQTTNQSTSLVAAGPTGDEHSSNPSQMEHQTASDTKEKVDVTQDKDPGQPEAISDTQQRNEAWADMVDMDTLVDSQSDQSDEEMGQAAGQPQQKLKSVVVIPESTVRNLEASNGTYETTGAPNQLDVLAQIVDAAKDAAVKIEQLVNKYHESTYKLETARQRNAAYQRYTACPLVKLHYETVAQCLKEATDLIKEKSSKSDRNTVEAVDTQLATTSGTATRKRGRSPTRVSTQTRETTNRSKSRGDSRATSQPGAGNYMLVMTAVAADAPEPIKAMYAAIDSGEAEEADDQRVHVAKATTRGPQTKIRFWAKEHAEKAMQLIKKHNHQGKPLTEYFDVRTSITAPESIRTNKLSLQQFRRLPFVSAGRLVSGAAAKVISKRNPLWFETEHDIESVEAHRNGEGTDVSYQIEIYTNPGVIKRFNTASKGGKGTIDLEGVTIDAWQTVREDVCHRCLEPGHWWRGCKAAHPNCKYCLLKTHVSRECKNIDDKESYVCYVCTDYNTKVKQEKDKVAVNHSATGTRCPIVKNRQNKQRQRKAAASKRPRHHNN